MAKITYYVGAGASANCLPCVNGIPKRIKELKEKLEKIEIPDNALPYYDLDITPYKGQANLLRALKAQRNYPAVFDNQVKIGTVHTFQGSECDIIIFDVVDTRLTERSKQASVGKIFNGKEGEQLLNVAVSRARYKLIVVGECTWFADYAGGNGISRTTRKVMRKIGKYRVEL